MEYTVLAFTALAVVSLVIRYLNATDAPKIKGIPEIPGWPMFGSLIEFGVNHAKVAGGLMSKYGPVFQVRLGNRVVISLDVL